MESMYAEAGVERKKTFTSILVKTMLIVACVILVAMATIAVILTGTIQASFFYVPIIVFIAGAMIVVFPKLNVEYEYIFCDGQFDIARIRGKATRKNVIRVDFENVELVAPYKSENLRAYQDLPKKDFSKGFISDNLYVMIAIIKDKKTKIFFEPSEKMLDCMRLKSASKVIKGNFVNLEKEM